MAHSTCPHPAAEGHNIPAVGWEGSSLAAGDRSHCSLAPVGNSAVGRVEAEADPAGRASHNIPYRGREREMVRDEGRGRRLDGLGEGTRVAGRHPG